MKPEEINITDWMRILMGEAPPIFLVEVIIRIVFLYFLLLISMRLMGNRMGGVLTRNEMVALVSMAASVGVSLLDATRGLLPPVIIATVVVVFQRAIARKSVDDKEFESVVLDDIDILVKDGCLNLHNMEQTLITREALLAKLRSEGIDNIGKMQRVYIETSGNFTFKKFEDERVGLSTLPDADADFKAEQRKAPGQFACASCGNIEKSQQKPTGKCQACGHVEWEEAVIS